MATLRLEWWIEVLVRGLGGAVYVSALAAAARIALAIHIGKLDWKQLVLAHPHLQSLQAGPPPAVLSVHIRGPGCFSLGSILAALVFTPPPYRKLLYNGLVILAVCTATNAMMRRAALLLTALGSRPVTDTVPADHLTVDSHGIASVASPCSGLGLPRIKRCLYLAVYIVLSYSLSRVPAPASLPAALVPIQGLVSFMWIVVLVETYVRHTDRDAVRPIAIAVGCAMAGLSVSLCALAAYDRFGGEAAPGAHPSPSKQDGVLASIVPWVGGLVTVVNGAVINACVGILISVALRVDYHHHLTRATSTTPSTPTPSPAPILNADGNLLVPLRPLPAFRAPTFRAALFAYAGATTCMAVHTAGKPTAEVMMMGAGMLGIAVVPLAVAMSAAFQGRMGALWAYEIDYMPSLPPNPLATANPPATDNAASTRRPSAPPAYEIDLEAQRPPVIDVKTPRT